MPDSSSTLDVDLAPPSGLKLPKHEVELSEDAPSADAAHNEDPSAIPPLTTVAATEPEQQVDALRLVADSVAQQRQTASRILILHPLTMALLVAVAGVLYQFFYQGAWSDFAIIGTTFGGMVMTVMVSVRAMVGGYLAEAERVGTWKWLHQGLTKQDEEESGKRAVVENGTDTILLTTFGSDPIGTIVFRGVQPLSDRPTSTRKSGRKSSGGRDGPVRTEIRGWTVRTRYRHKGVGTALLEDAIKLAHEKGWAAGGIEFASDHANSRRVLPEMFNGKFDADQKRAEIYLQQKVAEYEADAAGAGPGKRGKRR